MKKEFKCGGHFTGRSLLLLFIFIIILISLLSLWKPTILFIFFPYTWLLIWILIMEEKDIVDHSYEELKMCVKAMEDENKELKQNVKENKELKRLQKIYK